MLYIPDPAGNRYEDEGHMNRSTLGGILLLAVDGLCWREAMVNQTIVLIGKDGLAVHHPSYSNVAVNAIKGCHHTVLAVGLDLGSQLV